MASASLASLTILERRNAYDNVLVRYRVGVINDFNNTRSFMDYQQFGIMYCFAACSVGTEHRGYQVKDDAIYVFLNFKKVGIFKSRSEALALVQKLIDDCPKQCKKDFITYGDTITKNL